MAHDYSDKDSFLAYVARRINLREGPPRVEKIVRAIFDHEHEPGADALTERVLARITRLPVPVIEAVRRELEAAEVLEPGLSIQMSPAALRTLEEQWGWFAEGAAAQSEFEVVPATVSEEASADVDTPEPRNARPAKTTPSTPQQTSQVCEVCGGTGIAARGGVWDSVLKGLQSHFAGKPRRVQAGGGASSLASASPEATLRRVALMQEYGALAGKDVLVMGGDTQVAAGVALLGKALVPGGKFARRIVTLHNDDTALRQLRDLAVSENVIIGLVTYDLHRPLMPDLQGEFDTVFAVSPPALEDMLLVLNRAVDALKPGGLLFLSYKQDDPLDLLDAQREMLETGLLFRRVLPGFDGPAGDLYVLTLVDESTSFVPHEAKSPEGNGRG